MCRTDISGRRGGPVIFILLDAGGDGDWEVKGRTRSLSSEKNIAI